MTWEKIKKICITHKYLLIILITFFLLRFINLRLLPVFNDEAIYLDWGWRETTTPGFLFYSLYDAKQPFLMWIFAIFESIFSDPLFAGRFVSIFCGLASLGGLYLLAKSLWNKQTAYIASLLYAISPLFLFYDRQALMESAVTAIGIWACYFLIKLSTKPSIRYSILLGVTLGIGYFTKSSVLIFILASLFLFTYLYLLEKEKKKFILAAITTYITTILIVLPLLMQPIFWNTLPSNARFSLTLQDYLQFPIQIWWNNIVVFVSTCFFFLTPFIFLFSLIGLWKVGNNPQKPIRIAVLWLLLTIGIQLLVTRNSSVRYVISFLPLLLLFTSYFLTSLPLKFKIPTLLGILLIPLFMSLWQIFSPAAYILTLHEITPLAPIEYVMGQTSGYGISKLKEFIASHATSPLTGIGIAENAGNPESAMEMYYQNNPHIMTLYLDKKLLGDVVDKFDCLDTGNPLYFVSREEQQAGLNKFFVKIKTITNPYSGNTWGIYTLKTNCNGSTIHLNIAK